MIRICLFLLFTASIVSCNSKANSGQTEDQKVVNESVDSEGQNGKIEPYVEKYDNGLVKVKGQKLNGEKVGKWMAYYLDGKIWSEGFYDKGEKNGKCKDYYKNGNLRYKGAYVNDMKQGPWYFYEEDGKVSQKETYHKGEIVVKDK